MKFAFEDFIFVVGWAANLVGTMLESAGFCSGPNAKYSRTMVFAAVQIYIFPGKTPACSCQ